MYVLVEFSKSSGSNSKTQERSKFRFWIHCIFLCSPFFWPKFRASPSCKNASHCSSPPPAREGKSFGAGSEKKCKNCSTFDHITPESAALIFFSCSSSFACSLSRFPYLCRRAVAKKNKLNVRNAENLVGICLGRRPSGQLALPSFRFRKFQDEITKYV